MAQFYFSVNREDGCTLCLAPLTDRLLAACPDEIADASGYYLYERRDLGEMVDIEILAHVTSDEAALRLSAIMGMR